MTNWLLKSIFIHEYLVVELRLNATDNYKKYLQMASHTFGEQLEKITPLFDKRSTVMRQAMSPEHRSLAILRYLARSFEELKFQSANATQTLGKITVETCDGQSIF